MSKKMQAPAQTFSESKSVLTSLLCNHIDKFSDPKVVKSICETYRSEVYSWTMDQVCNFVESIDICAEYVQVSNLFSFNALFHSMKFFRKLDKK